MRIYFKRGNVANLERERLNIGIITFPIDKAGNIPLSNLVEILRPSSYNIYVITGNEGTVLSKKDGERTYLFRIQHKSGATIFTRIMMYIYTQLKISYRLAKLAKNVDIWIFFFGEALILPMLITKLLRKKSILAFTGSAAKVSEVHKDPLAKMSALLQKINYTLSNRIIIYSKRLIEEHDMKKYNNKICIAHEHFLDFDKFKIKKNFDKRKNLVGYIGRLTKAKGVLDFVQAIPMVLKKEDEIKFVIGGDGNLFNEIKEFIDKNRLSDKVELTGWIPNDKLPDYLNELKLVILPSYTEGLPNLLLEAMACGTPALATPVGAIPDMITDGETGFIVENNSPECIAENVIRALEYPNLDEIVKNARELVEKEFTYDATVESYIKILENM